MKNLKIYLSILLVLSMMLCSTPAFAISTVPLTEEDEFVIDSCATSREEIGNDIYPPAKRCLSAHGVPFTRHAARQIIKEDYANFDLILCMEEYNIRNLRQTLGMALLEEDARKAEPKIGRLLDRDVADPWYTGDFEATYRDVVEGCERLLRS